MVYYLNPSVVQESFGRLASKTGEGKTHLERTSAILYFLAFDAACQNTQKIALDLDPAKLEGRNNRKQLELEFIKLVLLGTEYGQPIQFSEFGKVDLTNIAPEKRLSANFLTVPLKKATAQTEPYYYPKRPNSPLLKLGLAATNKKWGISRHGEFEKNFFVIISTARSTTPAYDLAVLVLRDSPFSSSHKDIFSALADQLAKRFTPEVAGFLKKRIDKEKVLVRSKYPPFIDHYSNFIKIENNAGSLDNHYQTASRDELIAKIQKLEATVKELTDLVQKGNK